METFTPVASWLFRFVRTSFCLDNFMAVPVVLVMICVPVDYYGLARSLRSWVVDTRIMASLWPLFLCRLGRRTDVVRTLVRSTLVIRLTVVVSVYYCWNTSVSLVFGSVVY